MFKVVFVACVLAVAAASPRPGLLGGVIAPGLVVPGSVAHAAAVVPAGPAVIATAPVVAAHAPIIAAVHGPTVVAGPSAITPEATFIGGKIIA